MWENNRKDFLITSMIGVLLVVIIAVMGVVIFLLFGRVREEKKGEMQESEAVDLTDEKESLLDLDGFEFRLPEKYSWVVTEDDGPVIYMLDLFQLKLAVADTSYDEVMKDPDSLTGKVEASGGTITQDVTEVELNGKKYAYYQTELNGEKGFVVYTNAVDEKKHFVGQYIFISDKMTVDGMLDVFEKVTANATVTDKPNSPVDDLMITPYGVGEKKEESSLTIKMGTVSIKVPEGYISNFRDEEYDDYAVEQFLKLDSELYIYCELFPVGEWESAEEYIKISVDTEDDPNVQIKDGMAEVNGVKVLYYVETNEIDGTTCQEIHAVREINGMLYKVKAEAWSDNPDQPITFEQVRGFFDVK